MPEQNLNPDAVEAGAKALFLRERKYHEMTNEHNEPPNWEDLTEISWEYYRGNARAVLSALPAQPELPENSKPNQNLELQPDAVSSVEELEALPPCSVIVDKHGDAGLIEYGHVKFAETAKLPMSYVAKRYLPATVIYSPEKESSDGR